MRPCEVLSSAALLLLPSAYAAQMAGWAPIEALNGIEPIFRRQDEGNERTSFDLSFSAPQGDTATATRNSEDATPTRDSDATSTGDSNNNDNNDNNDNNNDDKDNNDDKGSETRSGTSRQTRKSSPTKTFDARLPAGGVSMITPNALTTQYYKINDYITFAWNYTSLSVTPSAVDVLASCRKNQETYTLALNLTVEETQSFTWDTGAFQATATVPLLTETYTLIIHDAAGAVTDRAQAGYLAPYDQFTFGMYSPRAYTPMSDYVCATCNAASSLEKQTWLALLGMVSVTVLTFGWFTGVAGLW